MSMNDTFKNAVLSKDELRVRVMLKDSLLGDPTLETYDEMIDFAQKNMDKLFDKHDGEILNQDANTWDKGYMNEQLALLVDNFSKERLELLKKMVQKLYYKPEEKVVTGKQHHQEATPEWSSKKKVGTALAVVGGVTAVAGIVTTNALVIGGGLGAAAVGAVLIVTDKEQ